MRAGHGRPTTVGRGLDAPPVAHRPEPRPVRVNRIATHVSPDDNPTGGRRRERRRRPLTACGGQRQGTGRERGAGYERPDDPALLHEQTIRPSATRVDRYERPGLVDEDRDGRQQADDGDDTHVFDPRRVGSGDPEGFVRISSGRRCRLGNRIVRDELRRLPDEAAARGIARSPASLPRARARRVDGRTSGTACGNREPEVLEAEDEPHEQPVPRVARKSVRPAFPAAAASSSGPSGVQHTTRRRTTMSAGSTASGSASRSASANEDRSAMPAPRASSPAGPSYSDTSSTMRPAAAPRRRRSAWICPIPPPTSTTVRPSSRPPPPTRRSAGRRSRRARRRGSAARRGAPPSRRRCPAGRRRYRSTASCHGATSKLPGATSTRACRRSGSSILRRPERGWTSDRERTRCGRT